MIGLHHILKSKYEPGTKEADEWVNSFPDKRGDETCTCGQCDGYGTIIEGNAARPCPASLGLESTRPLTVAYLQLHEMVKGWEGWPAPTFLEAMSKPGFERTRSFMSVYALHKDNNRHSQARILCGSCGRGKTLASLVYCTEKSMAGHKCFAFRFSDLIDQYKRGIDGRMLVDWYWRKTRESSVVLVDELGRQASTGNQDHVRQAIDTLVLLCYRQRDLIITTNLTKQDLSDENFLTANLQSRLRYESGYCIFVEDQGKDLRGCL